MRRAAFFRVVRVSKRETERNEVGASDWAPPADLRTRPLDVARSEGQTSMSVEHDCGMQQRRAVLL
jgi:hypothetical protein